MAGDWLKIRNDLDEDPHVLRVQHILGIEDVDLLIGKLRRLWKHADQHTKDGFIPFATAEIIDRLIGLPGFANAMASVGWLVLTDSGAQIPRFDEHNSESAKSRAQTARRVFRHSKKKKDTTNGELTQPPLAERYESVSESLGERYQEKRREEKKEIHPPTPQTPEKPTSSSDGPSVDETWASYLTGQWVFYYAGTARSERDTYALDRLFSSWIDNGIKPLAIRDAIRRRGRDKSQPTWEFKKELDRAADVEVAPIPLNDFIREQQRKERAEFEACRPTTSIRGMRNCAN